MVIFYSYVKLPEGRTPSCFETKKWRLNFKHCRNMCYMFLRNKGHLDHHWTIPKVQHQNGQGGVKVQCPCLGRVEVFFCSWIIQIIQIDLHLDMYLKCLNIEFQCFLTQLAIQLAFLVRDCSDKEMGTHAWVKNCEPTKRFHKVTPKFRLPISAVSASVVWDTCRTRNNLSCALGG